MLVDLQRIGLTALPEDSLVALLARAHRIRGVEDVAPLVDDALRVMRGCHGRNCAKSSSRGSGRWQSLSGLV